MFRLVETTREKPYGINTNDSSVLYAANFKFPLTVLVFDTYLLGFLSSSLQIFEDSSLNCPKIVKV